MRLSILSAATLLAVVATPAIAFAQSRIDQEEPEQQGSSASWQQAPARPIQAGRTADISVGEVGQRQTRERAAPNVQPLARINSRINNRVRARLANRIDRNYDPANATDPFATAENQGGGIRPKP